jgi:hypothetical protein
LTASSHDNSTITCENIRAVKTLAHVFSKMGEVDADWLLNAQNSNGQIDFAFSLSTNFINQYIQANHQTGFYEDYESKLKRMHIPESVVDRFGLSDILGRLDDGSANPNAAIIASYKTVTAPYVQMRAKSEAQSVALCAEIRIIDLPIGDCDGTPETAVIDLVDNPAVDEQISIIANGVELTLTLANGPGSNDDAVFLRADVDAVVYTKPTNMGLESFGQNFADVIVKKVYSYRGRDFSAEGQVAADLIAEVEEVLGQTLNAYGQNPEGVDLANLAPGIEAPKGLIATPVYTYEARDLPGIPTEEGACSDSSATTVCYSWRTILGGAGQNVLPIEFGVIFRALQVDKGGDHLLFALDFITKDLSSEDLTDTSCDDDADIGDRVPSDSRYVASLCLR